MADPRQHVTAEAAALAGAIERWAQDLALAEEPSGFVAALEACEVAELTASAPPEPAAPPEPGAASAAG